MGQQVGLALTRRGRAHRGQQVGPLVHGTACGSTGALRATATGRHGRTAGTSARRRAARAGGHGAAPTGRRDRRTSTGPGGHTGTPRRLLPPRRLATRLLCTRLLGTRLLGTRLLGTRLLGSARAPRRSGRAGSLALGRWTLRRQTSRRLAGSTGRAARPARGGAGVGVVAGGPLRLLAALPVVVLVVHGRGPPRPVRCNTPLRRSWQMSRARCFAEASTTC
ncbi:hypothetical protein [Umezawaea beigongshangensis]|uniref:hypothetical protein n=1 Tax=Umezawaea beigongshangensis TaxID=2780383 RepID=UPI0018F222B2|nr:hypothetical protein [Umezawaea beigongshangensis]